MKGASFLILSLCPCPWHMGESVPGEKGGAGSPGGGGWTVPPPPTPIFLVVPPGCLPVPVSYAALNPDLS